SDQAFHDPTTARFPGMGPRSHKDAMRGLRAANPDYLERSALNGFADLFDLHVWIVCYGGHQLLEVGQTIGLNARHIEFWSWHFHFQPDPVFRKALQGDACPGATVGRNHRCFELVSD